jgi:hypothetical protein
LWYISFWPECGGRSCRGESESQRPAADPGPVERGARSSSIIKVPASVGRAVLLGASYCTKARLFFPRAPPAGQAYGASVKRPRVPTTPLSLCSLKPNLLFVASEDDQGQSPPTPFPFVFLEMGRCSGLLHPGCPGVFPIGFFRMQLLMRSSLFFSLGSFHLYRVQYSREKSLSD